MDSVAHSALEEICCEAANGLHLRNLWSKLSSSLDSRGLPLCPNVKRAVWANLLEIPGLKLEACGDIASSMSTEDLIKCTVEECERMNVKIVASEATRKSFLGIYETDTSESSLSDTQRVILERLAAARTNGIAQSELAKELRIAANNLFYQVKRLETQGLIVRQPTVLRKKQTMKTREPYNGTIVYTNMLYLYRYGKHLGCQQRLEITKEDNLFTDREVADSNNETGDDFGKEIVKEDVHVKDFLPALKAICDKLEKARGKVLVVSDIKRDLGYRGAHGHRSWRNICHRLKDARVIEECCTMINSKEVNCLRLLQSFSPSLFEPKLNGRGHDDNDVDQSMKRAQITEQLVELPVLRQVYDMIDAAGSKGLTNVEVCRRLGLCSREYHKRYFKQLTSRFGLHLQPESHNKGEVYRVWTAGNFNPGSSNMDPVERDTVVQDINESNKFVVDLDVHENLSKTVEVLDTCTSVGDVGSNNERETDVTVMTEACNGTTVDGEGSSMLLLQCNTQKSDAEPLNGVWDEEHLQGNNSVTNNNQLEASTAVVTPPRRRSYCKYPRLTMDTTSSQREQRILNMLQEEKFLIKPELHRNLETLEKEKNTMMDRKTLERCLNKLQQEGYCKCIHVSVPGVTNCGRIRTTEVVLHPSVFSVTPELLAQIHDKMRSFEIQVRKQSHARMIRQKKAQEVPILESVQRISNIVRFEVQSEHAEVMRTNGFVPAKMVRTKLLHIFLWGWISSSPGWDDALFSSNYSCDLKNPHSTYKLFELDQAIRSMPLELFLQVIGSAQKFEDMTEKCRNGLLLCDLPMEEYKVLMDTRATGRLSWLIDILRRLKLIRVVSKGHPEDGTSSPHATLSHALELKPYLEEPVSTVESSGFIFPDLRPQVRHDFVLSSREAVDEYWNTLEYCYSAAKSSAASLAFPGCAVHEVFYSRAWASVRLMTAGQRVELLKHVTKDCPDKKLSFRECEKIAKDLNLTLEQVLRVYYDKRQHRLTRFQRVLDAEGQELQTTKGKRSTSSRKRKRFSGRKSSIPEKASVVDGQSSLEAVGPSLDSDNQFPEEQSEDYDCQLHKYDDGGKTGDPKESNLTEENEELHTFIHKRALSRLNTGRLRKFSWTEDFDRRLVIEYAKYRAALGAKFHRVEWLSISNLPAPPDTCKRRMALLNSYAPFRKAVMKLCNVLAERYAKYLEKYQDKMLNHGDPEKMVSCAAFEEDSLSSSAPTSGKWADFDENTIKMALDNVLRYKRTTKLPTGQDTVPHRESSEDDDFEDCGGKKPSGQRSRSRQLPRKYLMLLNKVPFISRQMHESVAIANAAELFKLIFLSNSKAPEVPTLLAKTLRRYSEHDLFAAFNYLREKKIMIGGSSSRPFALSRHFLHSLSSSTFPTDTGKRAAKFASWLHEKEKDLMEEGIDAPSDLQCGEMFILFALVSSGELSITPCLPDEGIGEVEDNRTFKRKCDNSDPDGGEISKKPKTTFTGEGEITSRREKGFPGIKLCLQRESISRLLAIESFKDGIYPAHFGGKDQSNILSGLDDVSNGSLHSDVADYVKEILDSGRIVHPVLDVSESPWQAMTRHAEYLMASCSYEVKDLFFNPHSFRTLYSAIQKSGDNGLSMKEICKILDTKDEKMLEVMIEVLGAFGRALKVNAYDSVRVVDSLYRSKYFLTSLPDRADTHLKRQKKKDVDEHMPRNLDNHSEMVAASENESNTDTDEVHRITILNCPEGDADPPTDILTEDKITGDQHSEVAPPEMNRVENFELHSADSHICRPLLPWMNGDGTINEPVYKGLTRRVLGIVMQNPGILEDGIINQMKILNPQSCRQLLEIMIMDNHIVARKMYQKTSTHQPPSILANLVGDRFRKPKSISQVHYFANPMSITLL